MMSVREGEVERQGETEPFVRERENERDRQEREEERKYSLVRSRSALLSMAFRQISYLYV